MPVRRKKKVVAKKYREQIKNQKKNRANFGMHTKIAQAYQTVHDALVLLEKGEDQVCSPEEIIESYFMINNGVPNSRNGTSNFEILRVNIMFEKPLDDLTSLLTGSQVVSKDRKDALNRCCDAVSEYYPINRRFDVKEETAKPRTSKKKTTAKGGMKKKVTVKKKAVTKKKVSARKSSAETEPETPKTRGRKAAKFVVFSGAEVDTNSAEEKLFGSDNGPDWEAFDDALKKGKVRPSTTIGYKDNEGNVFAQIINAIGGNTGKSVAAKNVVNFVVENLELSEAVARRKLYKLLDNGQLDIK